MPVFLLGVGEPARCPVNQRSRLTVIADLSAPADVTVNLISGNQTIAMVTGRGLVVDDVLLDDEVVEVRVEPGGAQTEVIITLRPTSTGL